MLWGTTGIHKLTNRCVNCGDKYFLVLVQSCGDNRVWLRFRKYTIIFTLRVHCVGQTYASLFRVHVYLSPIYISGFIIFVNYIVNSK